MADTDPQVLGPDGVLRSSVIFSTTVEYRFLSGTIPTTAVDVQVSINGSSFSSDTSLIDWGDGKWVVPNPVSEPNGLFLLPGGNLLRVRAILPTGSITPEATATVQLFSGSDLGVVASVPVNIEVLRGNNYVTVRGESSSDTGFRGMNYYASLYSGGGVSGYIRVNVDLVTGGTNTQETTSFAELDVTPDILVDSEGNPVADPMYFRVTGQQEDENNTVLQEDFNEVFEIPETARKLRIISTLSSVRDVTLYEFSHNRNGTTKSTPSTVQVGAFASASTETPLYYVMTALYYDSTSNIEYESSYSIEVLGNPTSVTTSLGALPPVRRQDIVTQFIQAVFRSNPQIKVETGSILRDTVIDPFSSESERLRFVLDFFQRARTPTLLLQIDDPTGSGTSIPVSQSSYKQGLKSAFYLSSATDVQSMIDAAFEAYASNFGLRRRPGYPSQGYVTFYTTRRPSQTLNIQLGTAVSGGSVQFTTTRPSSIPFDKLASYYDPVSGRYQVTVPVRSSTTGSSSNLGVGQVTSISTSLSGSLSVVNTSSMAGGGDQESNLALTVRVQNTLASVDSGTSQGYLQAAANVSGVIQVNVVSAGDDLMQRDLYEDGTHRGGKVDVWVQGENIATVTDSFAFSFEIGHDIQFEILGSVSDYKFRALDENLTEENPILEMIDDPDAGYEFKNASTGEVFDLTGVSIFTYNTIQLSTEVTQPSVSLTDVLLGSYRRRAGTNFTFPRQPVTSITSVEGTVSGALPEDSILLVHPDSPLDNGRSTLAGDYLKITPYTDDNGDPVPSGDPITIVEEEHVLVGQYPEYLDNLGANYLTLVVTDSTGTITYKGPNDPSGDPDYTLDLGTQTQALSITRTDTGEIPSGATVLVTYEHDENFTVTYTVNLIVSLTQDSIDTKKHVTADVLVKDAIPIPLDIQATIVLIRGRESSTVDKALRTNLENFFSNLRLGDPVRQSDIIGILEKTDGVSYVVVPLSLLAPQEGCTIVAESLSTDTASESTLVTSLSTNKASVYLLENGLLYATTDGGGPEGSFKAVFQNDFPLSLLESSSNLSSLGVASGRTYILGGEGRSIQGISDDETLYAQGYVTSSSIGARRKELTANHVLVSLEVGQSPTSYQYVCTYVVGVDSGAKNVDPGKAQYITGGTLLFTYDEDR